MELVTVLTGPFPRPEALVAATRDLDRGRTTREAVDGLLRASEAEIEELEGRLGLDPRSGGYLAWDDLFRPFADAWRGFTVGPLTRWFETNTFFRQPILRAPPERVAGAIAARLPFDGPTPVVRRKAMLPGPYTFAGLIDNRSGETREALTHRFGRLLADEVAELAGGGVHAVQFQEPLLAVAPPQGPLAEATVAAYRAIAERAGAATTLVWTFFGDAAPAGPLLARLPVSVVGFDLSETSPQEIPHALRGRAIGLGCIDPRTTLSEDPEALAGLVRALADRLAPPQVWLGPGAPLDLLPYDEAVRKLELLPSARRRLDRAAEGPT